jgi:P27 family predicted phage terminase small subunit
LSTSTEADPFVCGIPDKPAGLDELASREWDRLVVSLAPLLSNASAGLLFVACNAYSQLLNADRIVQEEGLTYSTTGEAGMVVRIHPAVRIRDAARLAYHRALVELGGSPVSQTRVRRLPEKKTKAQKAQGTGQFFTS